MAEPNFEFVAKTDEIPEGEGKAFEVGDRMIAVFNTPEGFRSIDDMCPHMGASLAAGHLENNEVSCPWHAWRFDVCDGTWCDNRRLKIDVFELQVNEDRISVRVDDDGSPLPVESDESGTD